MLRILALLRRHSASQCRMIRVVAQANCDIRREPVVDGRARADAYVLAASGHRQSRWGPLGRLSGTSVAAGVSGLVLDVPDSEATRMAERSGKAATGRTRSWQGPTGGRRGQGARRLTPVCPSVDQPFRREGEVGVRYPAAYGQCDPEAAWCAAFGSVRPLTGEVIRASRETACRYERSRPGELVHMDVKKLGRIPDGGGWLADAEHRPTTRTNSTGPRLATTTSIR
jgi:hypothetical protein